MLSVKILIKFEYSLHAHRLRWIDIDGDFVYLFETWKLENEVFLLSTIFYFLINDFPLQYFFFISSTSCVSIFNFLLASLNWHLPVYWQTVGLSSCCCPVIVAVAVADDDDGDDDDGDDDGACCLYMVNIYRHKYA